MVGTIDLYSLALTPNDTMYFDSVNAQTQWFNERQHLTIDNVSFNGARAFQLGNNYLDIIFNYNYVRYQLNGRYIYAFIENVDYTNDNCCSLQVSIDLNQTFLQELQTALVTSNIGNTTEKNSYFETYKPYDNKMSVNGYESYHLGCLTDYQIENEMILGFILLNVEPNFPISATSPTYKIPPITDNGYKMPCSVIAFPIGYNLRSHKLMDISTYPYSVNNGDINTGANGILGSEYLFDFLSSYGSYLVDKCIGITFETIGYIELLRTSQGLRYLNTNSTATTIYEKVNDPNTHTIIGNILTIQSNGLNYHKTYNLSNYLQNIPLALYRQPYVYLRIGNDTEYIELNLLDFFNNNPIGTEPIILDIQYYTSCIYPFTTNLVFKLNNNTIRDRNAMFNLIPSDPIPYRISAWENYYAQNKASVNDGLATQQSYERKQQMISTAGNIVTGVTDIATGLIPYTKAGNFYKYANAKGNRISDKQAINAGGSGVGLMVGAITDWSNSELEREKERKLLDIKWNDIKSSPSEFANMNSSLTAKYNSGPQCIEIDLYIATNINDIIKYHKQYGYKVNRMETLTWDSIKKHNVFDFISFNTITLKSTLPQFYTAQIEQHYEQGVRFWYDYDNFMNFEIENGEIA